MGCRGALGHGRICTVDPSLGDKDEPRFPSEMPLF